MFADIPMFAYWQVVPFTDIHLLKHWRFGWGFILLAWLGLTIDVFGMCFLLAHTLSDN